MGKDPLALKVYLQLLTAEGQKLQHGVTFAGKVADREYSLYMEIDPKQQQITLEA